MTSESEKQVITDTVSLKDELIDKYSGDDNGFK